MPNIRLTAKLTVLTVVSLTATGLAIRPAFSQSVQATTAEAQQTQPMPSTQFGEHKAAAEQLYRTLGLDINDIRTVAAAEATASATAKFETKAGRPLTEVESQQIFDFWHRKFGEILYNQSLKDAITGVYMRNFTLEELTAINQSADPLAQIALPEITSEIEAATIAIIDPFLSDAVWMGNMISEMLIELPFLLEQYQQAPAAV